MTIRPPYLHVTLLKILWGWKLCYLCAIDTGIAAWHAVSCQVMSWHIDVSILSRQHYIIFYLCSLIEINCIDYHVTRNIQFRIRNLFCTWPVKMAAVVLFTSYWEFIKKTSVWIKLTRYVCVGKHHFKWFYWHTNEGRRSLLNETGTNKMVYMINLSC